MLLTSVQLVHQPGIDGAKCEDTLLIGLLDLWLVFQKPQELANRGIGRERKTRDGVELVGAKSLLDLSDQALGSGICPDDGVVERLPGFLAP